MIKRLKKCTLNYNYAIQIGFIKVLQFIIALKGQIFEEVQRNYYGMTLNVFRNRKKKKDIGETLIANHTKRSPQMESYKNKFV